MYQRLRSVVRAIVLALNTPVAKLRRRRSLRRATYPIRLELGGIGAREGWVVTNVNALARNHLDAVGSWPLADASVEYVYADNMIEHVPVAGARALFAEARRCLQPGGVVRLVTPDLRQHVELYLAGVDPAGHPSAQEYVALDCTVDHPVDWLRIPFTHWGHETGYLYDFETLSAELQRAGFTDVRRLDVGESSHDALRDLEYRQGEGGMQMVVEATA